MHSHSLLLVALFFLPLFSFSRLILIASSIALLLVLPPPLHPHRPTLTDPDVVSPQNLNIKIRPALMPPARARLSCLSLSLFLPLSLLPLCPLRTPRKFPAKCFHKAQLYESCRYHSPLICTRKPLVENKDRNVPPPCHRCKVGRVARNWRYVHRI